MTQRMLLENNATKLDEPTSVTMIIIIIIRGAFHMSFISPSQLAESFTPSSFCIPVKLTELSDHALTYRTETVLDRS